MLFRHPPWRPDKVLLAVNRVNADFAKNSLSLINEGLLYGAKALLCQFQPESEPEFWSGLRRLAGCRVVFLSEQRPIGERLWRSGGQVRQGMGRPVDWHRNLVAAYSGW